MGIRAMQWDKYNSKLFFPYIGISELLRESAAVMCKDEKVFKLTVQPDFWRGSCGDN